MRQLHLSFREFQDGDLVEIKNFRSNLLGVVVGYQMDYTSPVPQMKYKIYWNALHSIELHDATFIRLVQKAGVK